MLIDYAVFNKGGKIFFDQYKKKTAGKAEYFDRS